jgi:hypothetical protein
VGALSDIAGSQLDLDTNVIISAADLSGSGPAAARRVWDDAPADVLA